MDLKRVGKRLVEERNRLKLKAIDVYTKLNIHQNTYRNYEQGKSDMPLTLLVTLWDMGFDAMYIMTGQHLGRLIEDAALKENDDSPMRFARRLVHLREVMEPNAPSDALLIAMYDVEDALIETGAQAGTDYEHRDLLQAATVLLMYKK